MAELNGMDVWAFEKMSEIIQMTTMSKLTGSRSASLKVLHGFLVNEFSSYYENNARNAGRHAGPFRVFSLCTPLDWCP